VSCKKGNASNDYSLYDLFCTKIENKSSPTRAFFGKFLKKSAGGAGNFLKMGQNIGIMNNEERITNNGRSKLAVFQYSFTV
jgi:hypothetical protein